MRVTPAIVGAAAGFLAVIAQAFCRVIPPPAYGICIVCHTRDLVNWILTHLYPIYGYTKTGALAIPLAPVSYKLPLLTVVGVFIGAFIAAKVHKEFKWKKMRVFFQRPIVEIFLGMLVAISALTMGGCPIRTTLKTAYLDITALIALCSIFVGVVIGCEIIKKIS